jgi:hypothetical protein
MRNTISSLLRLSGVHNTQDYFPYVPPEQIEQLDKQMKEAAAQKDKIQLDSQAQQMQIMKSMADAEMAKAQLGFQSKMADIQSKHQTEIQKLQQQMAELQAKQIKDMSTNLLRDDRERDKMQLQFIVDAMKLQMDRMEVAQAAQQANVMSMQSKPNGALQ